MIARRTNMVLGLGIFLLLACLSYGDCLTCLHCADIKSPRNCKYVMECAKGEICSVHEKMNEHGEVLFDLGCSRASMFSNRTHGTHDTCDDCCNSDLCNAAGCGKLGYPPNRGPICYSSSSQTTSGSSNSIDFCGSHEVCLFHEERELSDRVYTYKCAVLAQCEHYNLAIVGKSVSEEQRSVTETICHRCCHEDLCNKHCSYKDCKEVGLHSNLTGVYSVRPEGTNEDIEVYCDMTTDGGGWTVFQSRFNGSVDFYQNFSSYENGFGNVHWEFWLGLKYIHAMTYNVRSELRIDLMTADGSTAFEVFPNFRLSTAPNYTLHVDHGHGTVGDSEGLYEHNGFRFSTYDTDTSINCAKRYHGGWWYMYCAYANLNGEYLTPGRSDLGIFYIGLKGNNESLKKAKMMFRRV